MFLIQSLFKIDGNPRYASLPPPLAHPVCKLLFKKDGNPLWSLAFSPNTYCLVNSYSKLMNIRLCELPSTAIHIPYSILIQNIRKSPLELPSTPIHIPYSRRYSKLMQVHSGASFQPNKYLLSAILIQNWWKSSLEPSSLSSNYFLRDFLSTADELSNDCRRYSFMLLNFCIFKEHQGHHNALWPSTTTTTSSSRTPAPLMAFV